MSKRKELKKLKKTICMCGCHKDGVTMMHIMPCCSYTYEKYINKNGTVDMKRYSSIVVHYEAKDSSSKTSLKEISKKHPLESDDFYMLDFAQPYKLVAIKKKLTKRKKMLSKRRFYSTSKAFNPFESISKENVTEIMQKMMV